MAKNVTKCANLSRKIKLSRVGLTLLIKLGSAIGSAKLDML
jgi:hypothetical protein